MTIIVLLIITGLLLLILEFFVVPGITIAGIGGLAMIVGGIFMAYGIDTSTGHITLAITIFSTLIILFYALRTKTWQKLMLSSSINSNVDTVQENSINIGDTGKTITRLNPMGKARINGQDVEARCPGQFLDPKVEVEVTEVFKTYIIVKPVK
ncbi:NfeD family protein [Marinilabilia sp.]|uniref:NfeD family protein n=1 Tax=Marinilabilia sp. TaxID=2021252 RepID=UPI0025C20548|nr:NfeD family protein [Marinilabilia sp.]